MAAKPLVPTLKGSNRGQFYKGMVPWNKGKPHDYPGSRATRFKKGNKPGNTWRPVGSERLTKDGTLERKVADTGNKKRDWKPVKDIIWQAKHGRIPRGWFVVHRNRNRADFRLRNLVLVNRAANMERNTYHRYPKEIARLIQLRGALNRQINKRARHEEQDSGSTKPPVRGDRKGEGRRHAARPGEGRSGRSPGHHQQRQGGNRISEGARQAQGNRVHPRGRGNAGAAAASARR